MIFFNLCFKPFKAFLLRLNNLSFFGFLWNAWTWIATSVYFLGAVNIMFSWFVLRLKLSARLQNTRPLPLRRLEEAGKPVGKFTSKSWPWRNSLKAFFFFRIRFKVRTALSLFIVNHHYQLLCEFWHVTAPNRCAHVRIRPIARRIRNP